MAQPPQAESTALNMQAYMQEHLQDPITASDIAKAVGYSPYHASRLFKEAFGLSPFEYLRRERLLHAAQSLRQRKSKVLTVALDFVFGSHEGFTRAFANAFGISPKKYANHPRPVGWTVPLCYLDRQKTKSEGFTMKENTAVVFVQIVERPARKLILRRSKNAEEYFAYCEEVGCGTSDMSAPWDILCGIKEALYEPVGLWLPDNMRPTGTGIYAHGVEVAADYSGAIPEGFDIIELPSCKMMVFQGAPYNDDDYQEAVGSTMAHIETFNPEVYGYQYANTLVPRMQLAPTGWRGYIEMYPVTEK